MKTKTQELISKAKMYYRMVYVTECYSSNDLLMYMKLRVQLFNKGYLAEERNSDVVFKKDFDVLD